MEKQKMIKAAVCLSVIFFAGCETKEKYVPTKISFDGTYILEGTDNIQFTFSKDSRLTVYQKGIYKLHHNGEGEPVVGICLDDTSRELPEDYSYTNYRIVQKNGKTQLIYTSEEFDLDESPMVLVFLEGTDGILSGKKFDGTYQIGEDGDSYQYIFEKDGTITMQIDEHYYADDTKMTLSDHAGSTDYLYETSEEGLTLKNMEEETILQLTQIR